jgi:hypothetical protein
VLDEEILSLAQKYSSTITVLNTDTRKIAEDGRHRGKLIHTTVRMLLPVCEVLGMATAADLGADVILDTDVAVP